MCAYPACTGGQRQSVSPSRSVSGAGYREPCRQKRRLGGDKANALIIRIRGTSSMSSKRVLVQACDEEEELPRWDEG
jgi:hypothetical protein